VQEPSHPYISALANRRSSSTIASLSQPSGDIAVQHVSEDAGHIGRLALAKAAATVVADGLGQSGPFGGHVHAIDKAKLAGGDPIGGFETP